MTERDFIDAVSKIHADPALKGKILSGTREGPRRSARGAGLARAAVFAAVAVLIVLGAAFAPHIMRQVGTAGSNSPSGGLPAGGASSGGSARSSILLLGVDGESGRSDCVLLLTLDRHTESGRWTLTAFPRDLYVEIPGHGKDKLSNAYALGGAKLSVQTVRQNFSVAVDGYAAVDFNGFVKGVDRLGGIRLNLSKEEAELVNRFSGETPAKRISGGDATLTGKQALYYSRIRSIDGELQRNQREQAVAAGLLDRLKTMDGGGLTAFAADLFSFVQTDFDRESALASAREAYDFRNAPVGYFRPGDGALTAKQVEIGGAHVSVLVADPNRFTGELHSFLSGGGSNAANSAG